MASEVWSADFMRFWNKPILIDKTPFEMVNYKLFKFTKGMPHRV